MTGKGEIACFGELLLRFGAPRGELLLQNPALDVHFGGAEANVAVGLASLGHTPRMISRVPDNALGRAALRYLRGQGVDTRPTAFARGRMGLYYLVQAAGLRGGEVIYDREGSSFALASLSDFDWDELLSGVGMLHMSGITPALGPELAAVATAAARSAERNNVVLSFDGNFRGTLWRRWNPDPRPILVEIVGNAEILLGNHRDISLLLGRTFDGEGPVRRRKAAEAAFDAFPRLRLIASTSRRIEGADCHHIAARIDTPAEAWQTEEIRVSDIVDRIGAGDAFAAGILHGLRIGSHLGETVQFAHMLTCLKHGLSGDASLFSARDVETAMAEGADVRR